MPLNSGGSFVICSRISSSWFCSFNFFLRMYSPNPPKCDSPYSSPEHQPGLPFGGTVLVVRGLVFQSPFSAFSDVRVELMRHRRQAHAGSVDSDAVLKNQSRQRRWGKRSIFIRTVPWCGLFRSFGFSGQKPNLQRSHMSG
jgi:hypothetical protein